MPSSMHVLLPAVAERPKWWHQNLGHPKVTKGVFVPQKSVFGGHGDNARFARLRAYGASNNVSRHEG